MAGQPPAKAATVPKRSAKPCLLVTKPIPSGPVEAAIMGWLRANPWLELREDGQDYSGSIASKIAREASHASGEAISERHLFSRWVLGRLWRLQLEAFAPPPAGIAPQ